MKVGQINRGSLLGEKIYHLVKQNDIVNIVEIGTWNGMGSTKCIIDGLLEKTTEYHFLTIESNKNFYDEALENLKEYFNPDIEFELGRIIDVDELINIDKIEDGFFKDYPRDFKRGWLMEDIDNYKNINNIIDKIPYKIDLLILDGGEFSTYMEFFKLKDRTNYIVLDDTTTIKNHEVRKFILDSNQYEIIDDNPTDRNGYMIVKNLNF